MRLNLGIQSNIFTTPSISDNDLSRTSDQIRKSTIFLDAFNDLSYNSSTTDPLLELSYSEIVSEKSLSHSIRPLNAPLVIEETQKALSNFKSRATGLDEVHNEMLKHLSPANIRHLHSLFSLFLRTGFVPEIWKCAVIIPLLKSGKPPNQASRWL